ncbi:MAG: class I mannose-6-phosphate isomerase, partial [Chloroflexota bacterium]|nr:class I mannose-6-phosphate isomerase [Chloroflexota bacterium]
YADVPKRVAQRRAERGGVPNLGQPRGAAGSLRRLMFVDWPLQDRHRRTLGRRWTRYIDASDAERPRSVVAGSLWPTLAALASAPFRTRPSFLAQPWGGRWVGDVLGVREGEPNGGLGYELVAPESGILLGGDEPVEVPLDLLVADAPDAVLGAAVVNRFGASLPIRFDYLDTAGGGDLSVHCHPLGGYMREVFALPYTQHESYYVMVTRPGARIFLGLREDADLDAFRAEAARSRDDPRPLDVERFVGTFPALQHQLYLIPAGTPHGSGEGNVVLEISATPYLYSLRFYDWLRAGLDGDPRPVQLAHAFANLDTARRGQAVADELVPRPAPLRRGDGFVEHVLGRHPDLFFEVHRIDCEREVGESTAGRFHVLNLVEGDEITVRTAAGREHVLSYAETLFVPAAAGDYTLDPAGGRAKIVKAFVA